MVFRRKKRATPTLKKKLKRIVLDKTKWVRNTTDVSNLREGVLENNSWTCEMTGEPIIRPTLDHDHAPWNPIVRGVISQHNNTMEGFVKKYWYRFVYSKTDLTLPQYLRKMADYLEIEWDRGYHHRAVSDYQTKLCRLTIPEVVEHLKIEYNLKPKGKTPDKAGLIDLAVEAYIKKLEE